MNSHLRLAVLLCFAAASASAGTSEALRSASPFSAMAGLKALPPMARTLVQVDKPTPRPAAKKLRNIRLSGWINLSGSGFAPQHSPYVTVTVSGWTTLQDETGRTLNGSIHLSDTQSYFASGNWVSGYARPRAYVNIYDNGRLLGTVLVDGNVHVSGFKNGDWVHLNGSGQVSGWGTIEEPEPKP